MRRRLTVAALALLAGCHDYDLLEKDFCATATKRVCTGNSCTNQPVELCDDFETTIDAKRWTTVQTGGGTTTLARPTGGENELPRHAYRGGATLKLVAPPQGAAGLVERSQTAQLKTGLSLRFFLHPGGTVPTGQANLVTVRDATEAPLYTAGLDEGHLRITDVASGRSTTLGFPISPTAWQCVELDLIAAPLADGSMAPALLLFYDFFNSGVPALTLPQVGAAALGSTAIGLDRSADMVPGADALWMDEVILSDRHVGCQI